MPDAPNEYLINAIALAITVYLIGLVLALMILARADIGYGDVSFVGWRRKVAIAIAATIWPIWAISMVIPTRWIKHEF